MVAAGTQVAAKTRKPVKSSDALPELTAHPEVRALLGDSFMAAFESTMTIMGWGEDHIEKFSRAHPEHADRLWHSFTLIRPTLDLMGSEIVYRAHCTEIIERVISGEDTRPGTSAECCIACCETSQLAPLTTAATGLYFRVWAKAGLPPIDEHTREHYEAIKAEVIDEHERHLRRKLAQDWRTLPKVIEHTTGCPVTKAAEAARRRCLKPE